MPFGIHMKSVENETLRLPTGFGSLVAKAIRGLRVRYMIETPAEPDSMISRGEIHIAFETPSRKLFSAQLVHVDYIGPLRDGFLMLEFLPGQFSKSTLKRELQAWAITAYGKRNVEEEDRLDREDRYASFTSEKLKGTISWGLFSLTVSTFQLTLHTSEETQFVSIPFKRIADE